MKKGWSSGKVAAVILGSIGAAIVLVISLFVSVYQLSEYIIAWDEYETEAREQEKDRKKSEDKSEEWSWKEDGEETEGDFEDEDDFDYDYTEYYEFHDETRDDLSYQVSIEDFYMEADNGLNAQGMGAYPVITGENVKNSEIINNALKKEMSEIEKHVNEVSENIDKSESYLYKAECYVTYMDEDIFSIAYLEYGYLDGKRAESNVVSVNIDMDNGMVMTNTQLLEIDDFRRCPHRRRQELYGNLLPAAVGSRYGARRVHPGGVRPVLPGSREIPGIIHTALCSTALGILGAVFSAPLFDFPTCP